MTRAAKKIALKRWRHLEEGCLLYLEKKLDDGAVDSYQYGGRSLKYCTPKEIEDLLELAERKASDLEAELNGGSKRGEVRACDGWGAERRR